ncbi:MAG: Asp23/Gls24 family envelope stress response protein [Thermoflexales bacterium]|nr:Asp23/Gls24 family envelope stress response protein [Thermoflexales bacterium]
MTTENTLGRIEISPTAVATVAANAVTQAYGVVGLAAKNATDQLLSQLTGDVNHGVDVRFVNNEAVIDLYVIIEYGTRIVSVAHSVQNLVKFSVEKALGLPVASINVHVQGLRVSDNAA